MKHRFVTEALSVPREEKSQVGKGRGSGYLSGELSFMSRWRSGYETSAAPDQAEPLYLGWSKIWDCLCVIMVCVEVSPSLPRSSRRTNNRKIGDKGFELSVSAGLIFREPIDKPGSVSSCMEKTGNPQSRNELTDHVARSSACLESDGTMSISCSSAALHRDMAL